MNHPSTNAKLFLIGTNHSSQKSKITVKEAIKSINPHIILLELDKTRLASLKAIQSSKDLYGIDMLTAIKSNNKNSVIKLIDKEITPQREQTLISKFKLINPHFEMLKNVGQERARLVLNEHNHRWAEMNGSKLGQIEFGSSIVSRILLVLAFKRFDTLKRVEDDLLDDNEHQIFLRIWSAMFPSSQYDLLELRNAGMMEHIQNILKDWARLQHIQKTHSQKTLSIAPFITQNKQKYRLNYSLLTAEPKEDLRILAVVGKHHVFGMREMFKEVVCKEKIKLIEIEKDGSEVLGFYNTFVEGLFLSEDEEEVFFGIPMFVKSGLKSSKSDEELLEESLRNLNRNF